jgi:hypothetical protein
MGQYNPDYKKVLDELLSSDPRVRTGQMFGYPAYYTGKKAFLSLYENGISLKLPEKTVKLLLETDPTTEPFQPMAGRIMREWILIHAKSPEDYRQYSPIFEESIQFVILQNEK